MDAIESSNQQCGRLRREKTPASLSSTNTAAFDLAKMLFVVGGRKKRPDFIGFSKLHFYQPRGPVRIAIELLRRPTQRLVNFNNFA